MPMQGILAPRGSPSGYMAVGTGRHLLLRSIASNAHARRLASKDLSKLTVALPIDERDSGVGQGWTGGSDFEGEVDISQVSTYNTQVREILTSGTISLTKEWDSRRLGAV